MIRRELTCPSPVIAIALLLGLSAGNPCRPTRALFPATSKYKLIIAYTIEKSSSSASSSPSAAASKNSEVTAKPRNVASLSAPVDKNT